MTPERVLVFDLAGDYAQFRKFFTNMSPTTFSVPPRTVIVGIIGAIIGIDKSINPSIYHEKSSFVGIKLLKPIKKTSITMNYIKAVTMSQINRFKNHKPTNIEFLKDVAYRIYFSHTDDKIYNELKSMLSQNGSYYSISLGLSNCLAEYEFRGEFAIEKGSNNAKYSIASVIPYEMIKELIFSEKLHIRKDTIPGTMNADRKVTNYREIIFETEGHSIEIVPQEPPLYIKNLDEYIYGI